MKEKDLKAYANKLMEEKDIKDVTQNMLQSPKKPWVNIHGF